jgi:type IV secretion system protein VirB4
MKNSEAKPYFSYQDYILKVSGDNILRKATGFEQAMNDTTDSLNKFCHQQISLMIIGENLSKLDEQMRHVSEELSKIGIVHVREDINLEQTFWAQLPGNFSFLRRMTPNLFSNVAALASLHNFPTGSKISPWGKPITLLRTERGTPYFMNFHDKAGNGNFCIFGCPRVGKTVLSNFLISESTKFNPNVLYFTVKNSSKIFIESLEGLWLSEQKNLLNPFLLDDNQENRDFCKEFLKIICTHYIEALPEESLLFLDLFIDHIFKLDQSTRTLSTAIESMNFETSGGEKIKSRLTAFSKDGNYSGVFDSTIKFTLPKSQLLAVELNAFSHQYFEDRFYPSDKKQLGNYENQSKINDSVRVSIVYAFIYHFLQASKSKNIVALDDLHLIIDPKYYNHILSWISEQCLINNGITLSNIDLSILQDEKTNLAWKDWKGLVNTQIIMPSDLIIEHLDKILGISKIEENKLNNMPTSSRMFIVKQDGNSLVAELSIGGLPSILKILSGGKEELEIYNKIKENDPSHPENWLQALYNAFDGQ